MPLKLSFRPYEIAKANKVEELESVVAWRQGPTTIGVLGRLADHLALGISARWVNASTQWDDQLSTVTWKDHLGETHTRTLTDGESMRLHRFWPLVDREAIPQPREEIGSLRLTHVKNRKPPQADSARPLPDEPGPRLVDHAELDGSDVASVTS